MPTATANRTSTLPLSEQDERQNAFDLLSHNPCDPLCDCADCMVEHCGWSLERAESERRAARELLGIAETTQGRGQTK